MVSEWGLVIFLGCGEGGQRGEGGGGGGMSVSPDALDRSCVYALSKIHLIIPATTKGAFCNCSIINKREKTFEMPRTLICHNI